MGVLTLGIQWDDCEARSGGSQEPSQDLFCERA